MKSRGQVDEKRENKEWILLRGIKFKSQDFFSAFWFSLVSPSEGSTTLGPLQ